MCTNDTGVRNTAVLARLNQAAPDATMYLKPDEQPAQDFAVLNHASSGLRLQPENVFKNTWWTVHGTRHTCKLAETNMRSIQQHGTPCHPVANRPCGTYLGFGGRRCCHLVLSFGQAFAPATRQGGCRTVPWQMQHTHTHRKTREAPYKQVHVEITTASCVSWIVS